MKGLIVFACLVCTIAAIPVPDSDSNKDLDIIQIPINGNKELDILSLVDKDGKISDRNKRTIGMLRQLFPTLTKLNANPGNALESVINAESVRVARETVEAAEAAAAAASDTPAANKVDAPVAAADQEAAATEQKAEAKAPALDELSLENEEVDDNRDKRFLSFGFGGSDTSGGGGGSGNFLFDIIRLVGGSSGTQQTDEAENSPDAALDGESDGRTSDGYTEGIPGPITRLFVLANRGLANLIQDLILRLAQTSERVVNFKARLITSLI